MVHTIDGLEVKIIYSKRKSVAIELRIDGILVRAPKGMGDSELNAFLHGKRSWIKKHLVKIQDQKKALEQCQPFTMDEIRELADKALVVIPEKLRKYAPISVRLSRT